MTETIRVLLADDSPLLRAGVRAILATEKNLILVGEAVNGYEIQRLSQELQPDVLLLNPSMSGPSPFDITAFLRQNLPSVKVLVLITNNNNTHIHRLIAAGAVGCALKDETPEAVIRAIRAVAEGDTWFSHPIVAELSQLQSDKPKQTSTMRLTGRELEVLHLVAQGCPNSRIAEALAISERTVRFHLRNLYDKLCVNTRNELMGWVIREGLG